MFSTKIIMSLQEGRFVQWWESGSLPHPSTRRTRRGPKPSVDREPERKGSSQGSGKVASARGGGPRPREQAERLRPAQGSQAFSVGTGATAITPPPGSTCVPGGHPQTDTPQRGLWRSVGVLSPLPQPRGPRKEQLGAVAMPLPRRSRFPS